MVQDTHFRHLPLFLAGVTALVSLVAMGWFWYASRTLPPREEVLVMDRLAADRVMLAGRWYPFADGARCYVAVLGSEAAADQDSWRMPPLGSGYVWRAVAPEGVVPSHWGQAVIVRLAVEKGQEVVTGIYAPPATSRTSSSTPGT